MIDAYTIGITLALEDGVSDGITAIRRDLAELDVAVSESAARLLMLRRLAEGLATSIPSRPVVEQIALFAPPTFRHQPAPARIATPVVQEPAQAPVVTPVVREPAAATPPPAASPIAPLVVMARPDGPPSGHRSPVQSSPVERPAATPPAPSSIAIAPLESVAPKATPETRVSPMMPLIVPAAAAALSNVLPSLPPQLLWPESPTDHQKPSDFRAIARALVQSTAAPATSTLKPSEHPVSSAVPSQPFIVGTVDPTVPTLTPAKSPAPRPPAVETVTRPPPDLASRRPELKAPPPPSIKAPVLPLSLALGATPFRPSDVSPAPREPAAPIEPVRSPTPARVVEVAGSAQPVSPSMPPGPRQVDQATFAELHLDGAALGRWVTRHLERQVTRPQAGGTGFDPRMTPSWPGAPIGN